MKRFHIHIAVGNIGASIDFYSKLFGQQPTKQQDDYAKWMLVVFRILCHFFKLRKRDDYDYTYI